jgi:hypothetical protein
MENLLRNKTGYKFAVAHAVIMFTAMLLLSPSGIYAAPKEQSDVVLMVTQVVREGAGLEITCEIRNRAESDIWIYVGNNRPDGLPYEAKVSKGERKLLLGFTSVALPEGTAPEDALAFRYKKLGAGRTIMFNISLNSEVTDHDPLKGKGKGNIRSQDIDVLEISVGYYSKALHLEPDCCMAANRVDELFASPGWASSNKEETVSVVVSRKKRWK